MRIIKFSMMLFLFLVFLTGCSSNEKYLTKDEALAKGNIVLNGTISENRNRFEIFVKMLMQAGKILFKFIFMT